MEQITESMRQNIVPELMASGLLRLGPFQTLHVSCVHFEGEKEAFVTVASFSTARNVSGVHTSTTWNVIGPRRGDAILFHATEADAIITVEHKQ